jgi:hypothetical protein
MTRHAGISIDDDGITLVVTTPNRGASHSESWRAPATLVILPGGQVTVGEGGLADPGVGAVFSGFTSRVGDPVPVVGTDGSGRTGAELLALCIVGLVRKVGGAQHISVAVPPGWSPYELAELRGSLERAGITRPPVAFVPRPVAALATGPQHDGVTVVADIGRHGTQIATLAPARPAPEIASVQMDDFGVAELDAAVLRHIAAEAPTQAPGVELTARCRSVREQLSHHPAAVVETPSGRIRITRREFEESVGEMVEHLAASIAAAWHHASTEAGEPARIVLVGDASDLPLLTQTISAATGISTQVAPARTVATGAAQLSTRHAPPAAAAGRHVTATDPVRRSAAAGSVGSTDANWGKQRTPVGGRTNEAAGPGGANLPPRTRSAPRVIPPAQNPATTVTTGEQRPHPAREPVSRPRQPAPSSRSKFGAAVAAVAAAAAMLVGGTVVSTAGGHGGHGGYSAVAHR